MQAAKAAKAESDYLATPEELDAEKIKAGYAHRSLGGLNGKVEMERKWYVDAVQKTLR